MLEWKLEKMALMSAPSYMVGRERIFAIERRTSRKDKIAFVDSMTDGRLSYLLDLISKFEAAKETMPKDQFGIVKTNSLKAWMKKNDTRYEKPILDNWWQYGNYEFLNLRRNIKTNRKGSFEHYEDLVDECFHRLLLNLVEKERQYFLEHDEYSILKKMFRDYANQYNTTFGVDIGICSNGRILVNGEGDAERDITVKEIKALIENYKVLDVMVAELTRKTNITYESPATDKDEETNEEQDGMER